MNKARKHINDIEINDITGRWDAEPNDLLERIYIRDSGSIELIQKSGALLVCEINLNQRTDDDLPVMEISSISGENNDYNEYFWTIWRYSGNEMDIDFSDELRISFNLKN